MPDEPATPATPTAIIARALGQVMEKASYVQKKQRNQFHGYNYAGESDLLDVLRPAMVEAGLVLIPSITGTTGPDPHGNVNVSVEYTLAHTSGAIWPEKIVALGCGNDFSPKTGRVGDKGLYKAITGANKYLLFKLFQVETGDNAEQDNPTEIEAKKEADAKQKKQPPIDEAESEKTRKDLIWAIKQVLDLDDFNDLTKGKKFKEAWKFLTVDDQDAVLVAGRGRMAQLTKIAETANIDELPETPFDKAEPDGDGYP